MKLKVVAEVSIHAGRVDADELAAFLSLKGFNVELVPWEGAPAPVHVVREKTSGDVFLVTQDGWVVKFPIPQLRKM